MAAGYLKIDRSETSGRTTPRRTKRAPRLLWVRLGSVGGFTLGPLQPNKQRFIDANVTMTTCFNDRPASRLVERALRAEAFLLHMVAPGCSRADGPNVGRWILSRIASSRIIDRGLFEQSAGPLLHQMLNINHLLTMRSPNANHWGELDHVGPRDATEVDAFFGRSYLSFVCQAGGSRCGCSTRSKKCWERTT
jgi:hypothetical protein